MNERTFNSELMTESSLAQGEQVVVSGFKWNHCPDWNGIGVRFALEYAPVARSASIVHLFSVEYRQFCTWIEKICFLSPLIMAGNEAEERKRSQSKIEVKGEHVNGAGLKILYEIGSLTSDVILC
jgi:hypothetical protein